MFTAIRTLGAHIEGSLTGSLPDIVRRNMHVELAMSIFYGAFYAAALSFIPVVLRRMDATPTMLGVYASTQFLGSLLASLSIVLMRRRRPRSVIFTAWLVGRSLFLLMGIVTQAQWMIVLSALFWLLEAFPSPGYTRILQSIYPTQVRGKVMSIARMGRVSAVLLVTPLAGFVLDYWGYQILFPVAALLGIASTLVFTRLQFNEEPLPPRQTKTLSELWQILREDRRFAFYLFTFAVMGTGSIMSWTIYPLVQVDRLQLTYSQLGWLGLVQSLFWLLGFLVWGRLVDRFGGLFVLRTTCAVGIIMPFTYIFAQDIWMLLPAFAAQGLVNAGYDMGPLNSGIQLADPKRITEYAALQSTTIGLRGIVMSMVSVSLLGLGFSDTYVFGLSVVLLAIAWVMFGFICAPRPGEAEFAERVPLRDRWPLRFRNPRT
jgi:MFS transporter, DHA1 family, inner membrane transport protein